MGDMANPALSGENHARPANPYLRAATLDELLAWRDVDFVRCAFVTILGRQPDPEGETCYTREIRAGTSPLEILWRLRQSAEGRQHDPGIAGLDQTLRRAAVQRRPLLGLLARLWRSDADGNSRTDRALRSLVNAVAINQRDLHSIAYRLTRAEPLPRTCQDPVSVTNPGIPAAQPRSVATRRPLDPLATPELQHLRNQSPLALYFQRHAS